MSEFAIDLVIAKAVPTPDGGMNIHGIASDESLDLDHETLKASGLVGSLAYLRRWGKFNWDHGNQAIGDVTDCRLISPQEAQAKFPALGQVTGRALYVEGKLYPILPSDAGLLAPEDLTKAHYTLKAGGKLGFSVQGTSLAHRVVNKSTGQVVVRTRCLLHRIALTPHPKNVNTLATLQKSLSAPSAHEAALSPEAARVLRYVERHHLHKATVAGAGTDHALFRGGRSLVPESLEGVPKRTVGPTRTGKEEKKMKKRRGSPDADLDELVDRYGADAEDTEDEKEEDEEDEDDDEEAEDEEADETPLTRRTRAKRRFGKSMLDSLADDPAADQAMDVSPFLVQLAKSFSDRMEAQESFVLDLAESSERSAKKVLEAVSKALTRLNEIGEAQLQQQATLAEMQSVLESVTNRPVGRRSQTSPAAALAAPGGQAPAGVLEKGVPPSGGSGPVVPQVSKSEYRELLEKAVQANKITPGAAISAMTNFERHLPVDAELWKSLTSEGRV